MMKRRKKMFLVLMVCLVVHASVVFASERSLPLPTYTYEAVYTGNLQTHLTNPIFVRFKNGISGDKRDSGAETWTDYPFTATSVTVTFYWVDYQSLEGNNPVYGTTTGFDYGSGNCSVEAPRLTNYKYYYKVVSSHNANYDGATLSKSNLTKFVP